MSEDEINGRRILCESGISQERIHRGLGMHGEHELDEAAERVASRPFSILAGSPSPSEIRAHARMVKGKPCGLGLVVVDYLQLLAPLAAKYQNRETLVAATSRAFQKLAGGVGVPVVLACQLNRNLEKEEREPRLSDMRESGAIEQDADVMILLHRIAESEDRTAAIIAKARNWRPGRTELRLRGELFRFESYAHSDALSAA